MTADNGSAVKEAVDALLRLTGQMAGQAAQGNWEAVREGERQRQAIIGSLAAVNANVSSDAAGKLRQMLEMNEQITALAAAEKNRLAAELRLSRSLGRAEQAYRAIDAG